MLKPNEYIFYDTAIEFKFYQFYFSSIHSNNIISLDRINAIDLNTYPHSFIIDNREILFLNHNDKHSLKYFAEKHNIPQSSHIDTWSILTREYLDTELEEELIDRQNQQLAQIGIDAEEYRKLSRSVRGTLFGTMEWQYLGLWDVIAMKQYRSPFYRFFGKDFYWYTMNVALRGSEYVLQE